MKVRNMKPWSVELRATEFDVDAEVRAGGVIDVAVDLGQQLIEQEDNWQRVMEQPAPERTSTAAKAVKGA